MTNVLVHPEFQNRRREVKAAREENYNVIRDKVTEDLRRTVGILTELSDDTKLDLVKVYAELAQLLYLKVKNTPPNSPLSDTSELCIQHLWNGIRFLSNLSQRAAAYTNGISRENESWNDKDSEILTNYSRQKVRLVEEVSALLKSTN